MKYTKSEKTILRIKLESAVAEIKAIQEDQTLDFNKKAGQRLSVLINKVNKIVKLYRKAK
jgi:hypothetical protein